MSVDRKEAIRQCKERKSVRGVFAVHCAVAGRVWVGSFTNLEAMRTRLWFSLRGGMHPNRALQQEWNTRGEAAFEYEILERFDDDLTAIEVNDLLKDRWRHWLARLAAEAL